MAKKQSRRSVSLNRSLYEQAKQVAEVRGVPLAQFVEGAVRDAIVPPLERVGVDVDRSGAVVLDMNATPLAQVSATIPITGTIGVDDEPVRVEYDQ